MAIFHVKTNYKWPCSVAILNYQRVHTKVATSSFMQAQHLTTLQPKPALRDEQTIAVSDTLPPHRTPKNATQNLVGGFNPSEKL